MQVHFYRNNGYNIMLDVPSGSVHVADGLLFETAEKLAEGKTREEVEAEMNGSADEEELREVFEEIETLRAEGSLFSDEPYEPAIEAFASQPVVIKALCLHVAHDCNLACRYCFAGEGEYHGERGLMTAEVGKKALDLLVRSSGLRRNLEVDFFGGEPLLNWKVVKELVAYGRELEKKSESTAAPKRFRFTITTNGLLLNDEIMDFCDREMDNVVLSMDGRPEVHDRMRPFPGGSGSYDLILPKVLAYAKRRRDKGLKYYVRGTYTHYNLDFAEDVLHFADLGIDQISVEPVVADPKEPYAIRAEDIPFLKEQYDLLAKEMLRREREGNAFNFFHFMIDLSGGPCVYKRLSGCGSGTEYLAVTPWGDLYPCHQFVGMENFRMGDVDTGVTNTDLRDAFRRVNVYSKEACRKCFARFYCSGGCAANAYNFSGDVNGAYEIGCELQKKRIECAIMMKAAEAEQEYEE